MYELGDRVTRPIALDDGTWNRLGDRCLPGPLKHGIVTRRYLSLPLTSAYNPTGDRINRLIDVQWDDGSKGTYFHHGVNRE